MRIEGVFNMSLLSIYGKKERVDTIRRLKALKPIFSSQILKIYVMSVLLLFTSCAHKPVTDTASPAPLLTVTPNIDILVLRPLLKFERIQDEAPLPHSDYQGGAIEADLFATARNVIESKRFIMVDSQAHQDMNIAELCEKLQSQSAKLSRGIVSDEIEISLKQLASFNERSAVFVQLFRVKIGPEGYWWKPLTGEIASSMSSSSLQASLIHCSTGQVLWRKQVLLRGLPRPGSSQFSEMLKLLYQDFPRRKEE
jgi:hypothetical protein